MNKQTRHNAIRERASRAISDLYASSARFHMRTLAAVALILASLPGHAADFGQPWDTGDKVFGGVALTATLLDWRQTRYIAKHPEIHWENNRMLGLHPSVGRVNSYFMGSIALGLLAADIMPSAYRKAFLAAGATLEINMLARNVAIGIPF